ncbi:MAG: GNAT family N-acetyltransferase [Saprospirales bacterium]|nr:GNAT family N-acetyltransferase [Saprospirales bacterium]
MIGLATFEQHGEELELTLLDSRERNQGIGALLVANVLEKARQLGCVRVWTVTTNDNIRAFRFYQKRGFDLVKIHPGAVDANRGLKPEIPMTGQEGIPIRHELEFEYRLRQGS